MLQTKWTSPQRSIQHQLPACRDMSFPDVLVVLSAMVAENYSSVSYNCLLVSYKEYMFCIFGRRLQKCILGVDSVRHLCLKTSITVTNYHDVLGLCRQLLEPIVENDNRESSIPKHPLQFTLVQFQTQSPAPGDIRCQNTHMNNDKLLFEFNQSTLCAILSAVQEHLQPQITKLGEVFLMLTIPCSVLKNL